MNLLILQIVIKQWDKGQQTAAHVQQRAAISDKYALSFPPAFYAFDNLCVIDQHGDDIQGTRLSYSKGLNGNINFDRYQINLDDWVMTDQNSKADKMIGSLNNQWIQCKYNQRYSIYESDMYYWLYEDVTVNAISVDQLNDDVFLNTAPDIVYKV